MKELVEYIARSLVDHPDSVQVEESQTSSTINIELTVADSDMGRVIGRGGRVVNAMRTVVSVAGDRKGKRINLEVVD